MEHGKVLESLAHCARRLTWQAAVFATEQSLLSSPISLNQLPSFKDILQIVLSTVPVPSPMLSIEILI